MQKFIKQIRNISEKIYDEIAGCEERYFQVALSIELNKKGINFLRETSVQFFYDKYPLSLFIFDFLIYMHAEKCQHGNVNFHARF